MNTRLKQARLALGLLQEDMANSLKISQCTYSQFETGGRVLQPRYIQSLEKLFGISSHWLETGEGDMFIKSSQEDEFLEAYNSLTDESKEIIMRLMLQMKKEEG